MQLIAIIIASIVIIAIYPIIIIIAISYVILIRSCKILQDSCKILQDLVPKTCKKINFFNFLIFIWNKKKIWKFINLKHFLDKKKLKIFFAGNCLVNKFTSICLKKSFLRYQEPSENMILLILQILTWFL